MTCMMRLGRWRPGGAFLIILVLLGWTEAQKKHAEKIAEKLKKQKLASTEKPKLLTGKKSQRHSFSSGGH